MQGSTFFVTGGNTGIGLATAKLFASHGANIAILSLGADLNAAAEREISELGVECLAITGDVTKRDDVEDAVERVVARFGRLDYAFNNAGIPQRPSYIGEQSEEEFDTLVAVDIKGVWLAMRYEIPAMLAGGRPGAIVNSASAAGIKAPYRQLIYAACKHAVVGLTKGAAFDHAADGIRVNAIAPGIVNTEMIRRYAEANPDHWDQVLEQHIMGTTAEPEDVAAAVLFLCRDAAKTTGTVFTIDSGRLLY
ncbi:short chain dehydrogenase [Dactylosporangium sucinum]|uniref:Short chain dehydrogenase n=1 Tax=Dactylosporangium sucinum TaxID=1424081 RepID=A0A917X4B3_9ACTN|nr:short chain dehydrogenase [Dactylosporangium sucinum]